MCTCACRYQLISISSSSLAPQLSGVELRLAICLLKWTLTKKSSAFDVYDNESISEADSKMNEGHFQ